MARSCSKEDKLCFFKDLERLCEVESESEYDFAAIQARNKACVKPKLQVSDCRDNVTSTTSTIKSGLKDDHAKTLCSDKETILQDIVTLTPYSVPLIVDLHRSRKLSASKTSPQVEPVSSTDPRMKRTRSGRPKSVLARDTNKFKGDKLANTEKKKIFQNLVFFFVPNDDVAKPRKMRIQMAQEHGAEWARTFDGNVTHVLIEPHISYSEAAKAFPDRQIPEGTVVIKTTWLGESLEYMYLRDVTQSRFQLEGAPPPVNNTTSVLCRPSAAQRLDGLPKQYDRYFEVPSTSADTPVNELNQVILELQDQNSINPIPDLEAAESFSSTISEDYVDCVAPLADGDSTSPLPRENQGFQCMESNSTENGENPNHRTIAVLQEMATYYDRTGDRWRTTAYRRAITALRKQKVLIATRKEALAIPQIGSRLADKIEEIVVTSRLRRLESTRDDPHAEALTLFMGIYGVGPKQALHWIAQGYRTLSDLVEKAKLSSNQRVGIARYDDFQQRIPRSEIAQHAAVVRVACHKADKDLQVIVGGSYRRGNPDSGDIDLLITKSNADMSQIRTLLVSHVIPSLTNTGFLKCTFASSSRLGSGSKWHGASCLSGSTVWRRIDLLFVPGDELGAALLYFTGNDVFNRSMRLLAGRKGMRLNQHGLFADAGGDAVATNNEGSVATTMMMMTTTTLIEGKSERRIFDILGVPWREPHERQY